jgi:enoyl-CoA hydratase/carnithine racemase
MANGAPLALRAAKTMALTNQDISLQASNRLERQIFASLFGTADQKEGMTAFLEKRSPKFVGA